MKDEQLKNIWNIVNDDKATLSSPNMTSEQFVMNRSGSIQDKIRSMLQNDLILKSVSGIALLLNLLFYRDTPDVLYVCIAGVLFLSIMSAIEWKTLKGFNKIADPGLATRNNLSNILIYVRRKANLFQLTIASSQILIFVPGLLLYFYLVYGHVKPMTGESFIVYTVLCLVGTIASFQRIKSQLKYHLKNLSVCLSDLNENSLGFAFETIENQRKQDHLIQMLVYFLSIFGFVMLIIIMKSVTG